MVITPTQPDEGTAFRPGNYFSGLLNRDRSKATSTASYMALMSEAAE